MESSEEEKVGCQSPFKPPVEVASEGTKSNVIEHSEKEDNEPKSPSPTLLEIPLEDTVNKVLIEIENSGLFYEKN